MVPWEGRRMGLTVAAGKRREKEKRVSERVSIKKVYVRT